MFPIFYYLLVIVVSVLLVLIILPSVIHVAKQNNLFDDHSVLRKEHRYGIPRLGGIAFYLSIILTSLLITKVGSGLPVYNFYAASIILFSVGIKDDLSGVHFRTKLAVQAVVAVIITVPGNIRITNLHGIFNIHEMNYATSVFISALVIMFIVNSFNLIDGIDGLAGTLGLIACCTFGYYFILINQTGLAALALSTAGSLAAFLAYNYSPAKVFMGDAGSMFIGMMCAVFAIKFISVNEASTAYALQTAPAFAAAVLIVPAFDTCNVVITRIYNRVSPFKPDRNHIHHRMLRLGLTHVQTTLILSIVSILFIGLALLFKHADNQLLLLLFAGILIVLNSFVNYLANAKPKQVLPAGNLIR